MSKEKVVCYCVHGTCREGEGECSGGCKDGWRGNYCDIPTNDDVLKHVVKDKKKDFTKDGLYRPQSIEDETQMHHHAEAKSTSSSGS